MAHFFIFVLGGIGGEKGEGIILVPALHQMEKDALRNLQVLALFRQIHGHCAVESPDLPGIDFIQFFKNTDKPIFRDMFRSQSEGDAVQQSYG